MIQFNDNPIIVDTNSKRRNRKQKLLCVLCKIELNCISETENKYRCPRCKNTYQLGFEILPHEDIMESSHEEEDEDSTGVGLLVADDDDDFDEDIEEDDSKSDIKIPPYLRDSTTTKLIEYREE